MNDLLTRLRDLNRWGNSQDRYEAAENIEELRAALKTSICPAGSQTVEDCIRAGCGCDNREALGSVSAPTRAGGTLVGWRGGLMQAAPFSVANWYAAIVCAGADADAPRWAISTGGADSADGLPCSVDSSEQPALRARAA